MPAALADWLFDRGSLTGRLRGACPGAFRVRLLGQGWAKPLPGEARRLGLAPVRRVWVREVQLLCADRPWVFARTLIPPATLAGRGRRLTRLGTRPLGEVLFTDPGVRRGLVEAACLRPGQRLHRRIQKHLPEGLPPVWGRRSLFVLAGRPLLVCEFFLPDLPAYGSVCPTAMRPL